MHRIANIARGFTLLEVVVTLAVLSLSLTAIYQVFSSVARGTRVSSDYYTAIQIAQSRIALLSARGDTSGSASGTVDNYYHWQTSVEPYIPSPDGPLAQDTLITVIERNQQPYLLSVNVSWGEGSKRQLELSTIRLESAQ